MIGVFACRHGLRDLTALCAVCLLAGGLVAQTWQVGDSIYREVRVQKVTPATVTIFHSGGIQQLPLDELSPDLQERFHYNPESAASWLEERQRERQAKAGERLSGIREKLAGQPVDPASESTEGIDPATVVIHREMDLREAYREMGLFSKDQGSRPSCSVFAVVSAFEYASAIEDGTATQLSEEFLLWSMREMYPGIPLDSGFHFREVISALQTYGVPPYSAMPNSHHDSIEFIQPSGEAIRLAESRRAVTPVWFRPDDPHLIKRIVGTINKGNPVIVGLRWPNWRTFKDTNLLHMQKPLENAGHAVTLVGYRNKSGTVDDIRFIFRNSYGQDWGLQGFAFVTGHYLRENLTHALYLKVP